MTSDAEQAREAVAELARMCVEATSARHRAEYDLRRLYDAVRGLLEAEAGPRFAVRMGEVLSAMEWAAERHGYGTVGPKGEEEGEGEEEEGVDGEWTGQQGMGAAASHGRGSQRRDHAADCR